MALTKEQALDIACGIQGWHSRKELAWMYDLATAMPEGGCWVEIGVWKGRSIAAAAFGASENSFVTAIDNFIGNPYSPHHFEAGLMKGHWLESNIQLLRHLVKSTRNGQTFEFFRMDGEEAGAMANPNSVDVVYLDGDPQHFPLARLIEVWLPALNSGGTMAGHGYQKEWEGVLRALEALPGHEVVPETTIWKWVKP
jgi:hypothetical protein